MRSDLPQDSAPAEGADPPGEISLRVDGEARSVEVRRLLVAGFTGRSRDAVQEHIDELAAEGVTPPDRVPTFYRLPAQRLIQGQAVRTTQAATSGEAEIALVFDRGEILVTLASDHTDREVERADIGASKLACPKPVAEAAWRLDEVADRWDELELRSWVVDGEERVLYQRGTAGELLAPADLLEELADRDPGAAEQSGRAGLVLLTGTVPAIGGVRPAGRFEAELLEPRNSRCIRLHYEIQVAAGPNCM